MKDTYWLEKRIEGLEKHIENLYEVIEEWKAIANGAIELNDFLLKQKKND
jgi:uncharacterized membrane protein YjdF